MQCMHTSAILRLSDPWDADAFLASRYPPVEWRAFRSVQGRMGDSRRACARNKELTRDSREPLHPQGLLTPACLPTAVSAL